MSHMRRTVLGASFVLLAFWIWANFARLTGDQHGMVRFVLGTLFALLILLRPKRGADGGRQVSAGVPVYAAGVLGALLAVGGIVFNVRQFEWVGIMLLLFACWRWSMPSHQRADIRWALFLLYWVHPLPSLLFANLQVAMQKWSVSWAEWLLHARNVRVWADGFFLYAGFDVIGVPESCSGMRTGVTVLLCALGIGILYRFRWWELALLTAVGIVQVIMLNALRIAAAVIWAPQMPREWSDNFLHDTLGMLLMVAIVLTQIEASLWQVWRARRHRVATGIARDELERPERATRLPRFWHLAYKWSRTLVSLALVSAAIVAVAYKSRPVHREIMRREVIDSLIETDLEAAERAIALHLRKTPADRELLAKKARIQVMRRDFQGALNTFEALGAGLSPLESTLKSWSLMAMGRTAEAVALIDALPVVARQLPGVAMVRAEYAVIQGDPVLASHYLGYAGGGIIPLDRIRALFPFLARHEQWAAIAKADGNAPYAAVNLASIAIQACLRVNNLEKAAAALLQARRTWGNDPRFLRDLFVLASRRPGGEWEERFAESFRLNYDELDAEQLVPYIGYCFQLSRPELAWLAFLRLLKLDARHPDVFYTPAQFGSRWFEVRRRHIGLGGDQGASIDLRPLVAHTRHLWPVSALWRQVPLEKEFAVPRPGDMRDRYMAWTLTELETRERNGTQTRRGELLFPSVLAAEGRFDDAHRRLDQLRERYPLFAPQVLLQHAEFYDQHKDWQASYEALREYYVEADLVELKAELLMVNSLLNLNLAVQAMEVAGRAATTFPGVRHTDLLQAAIWDIFGFREEALFVLGDHEDDVFLNTAARLLTETGRLKEAERVHGILGRPFDRRALKGKQGGLPMPAELVTVRRWPPPPGDEARAREREQVAARAAAATSPFIRDLERLTADWMGAPTNAATADRAAWRAVGRDALEQASALHRLSVLLARSGSFAPAMEAVREALTLMPDSAILHRVLIALTEGDRAVVEAARRACPDDSEIWLAWLVAETRAQGSGDWALAAARAAIQTPRYAPGAVVRAGDYLLRLGMPEAATLLAQDALTRSRGLVSATMLGLRCALSARNADWALECARAGIEHALDPSVFYEAIVEIKSIQATPDADLVRALEYLKDHFPKDSEWAQYLGHIYFQSGDGARALTILEPVLFSEMSGVRVRSLLLAAEAARVSGNSLKAVGILEKALTLHPEALSVLNNLVYNLAMDPKTAPRAAQLLPRLLRDGDATSSAVLDTAAMVCLRTGRVDEARAYMERALALVEPSDYAALETRLNAAEVWLAAGDLALAQQRLREVRRDARLSSFLESRARRLEDEISRRQQAPRP